MAFPIAIHFGTQTILLHTILEALAFFIGFRYFLYLRKKEGDNYDSSARIWIVIGAIFGALVGSRLIGCFERPYELRLASNLWYYFYNNKTVVGGFLGGLLGVEITKKLIDEHKSSGDLFVYPIILALIIGRIGCFSMGVYEETYGLASKMPWAMNLGDGIYRHPVNLYEIAFLVLLWTTLSYLQKKKLRNGVLFKLFIISYLIFRFLLEFIKPHYKVIFELSTIQLTCLAGLLYYLTLFIYRPKPIANYA